MSAHNQASDLVWNLWFLFCLVLLTAFYSAWAVIRSFIDPTGYQVERQGRRWAKSILRLAGVTVQVEGMEHLTPGGTYVFAANHRSQFDIFVLFAHLPGPFLWIAKKSLFRVPLLGQALSRMGSIPVERGNLSEAKRSLNLATERVKQGYSMIVFPEGTRATSRELLPFKKGLFIMALKAGRPVVPVSISGTNFVQPPGVLRVRPGPVRVVISPPLDPRQLPLKRKEDLAAAVRQAIEAHFDPDFPYGARAPRS